MKSVNNYVLVST